MTLAEDGRRGRGAASLVDVVAYAAIAFLYERDTRHSLSRVLARLGHGLEVDHVLLAPLDMGQGAEVWSAAGGRGFDDALAALPGNGAWMRDLAQGSVVAVGGGRGADADLLAPWGATALVIAPVFVGGAWWGILAALDDGHRRLWSPHHRKVMLAVAGILSTALESDVASVRLEKSRSDLVLARKQVETYRARLDELVLASHDAILVIEPDGFVSRWNGPADALFSLADGSRPGRDYRDFLPFTLKQAIGEMVEAARCGRASHARAFDLAVGTGCRNLLVSAFPLGAPTGTVAVIVRDQTETVEFREKLEHSLSAAIAALASAMEARDPYTAGHQRRTGELARAICRGMGMSEEETRGVHTAAVIHDIGKICVPAEILTCPRRLHPPELALIRMHSQAGHDIIKGIAFPWPVATMVLQHHERLDGGGYPHGIRGDDIHPGARIIGVADTVEAITNHRPYRPALGLSAARAELLKGRGTAYDAQVVDACLAVLEQVPAVWESKAAE